MKKIVRCLAVCLALLLMLPLGASARENTEGLLATVNGSPIPVDEAYAEYEYYAYLYQMMGATEEDLAALKEEVARYYVDMFLLESEFDKLGLSIDEEEVALKAEQSYEETFADCLEYLTDEEKTEEENRQAAEEYLSSQGYTRESVRESALTGARVNAVVEHYTADLKVTEEEVQADYERRLSEEQEAYDSDPLAYESAAESGEIVTYVPEGFRRVKHILVLLSDEDQSSMYELQDRLGEIEDALKADDADTEALNAEKEEISAQMDELMATIQPKVEEIQQKLADGADFLDLMAEYGEDPGMQTEPYATEGYLVHALSEAWETAFRDAAVALEKPGDISEPVRTPYGLHLIRYEEAVESGAIPLEDVRDVLTGELLSEKKQNAYAELTDRLYGEAEVTLYLENLDAAQEEEDGEDGAE